MTISTGFSAPGGTGEKSFDSLSPRLYLSVQDDKFKEMDR